MNKWIQVLMRRLEDEAGGDGGAGGGSGTGGASGGQGGAGGQPETFSREYVTELRRENATYRTKAAEAAKKAEEAESAAAKAAEEAESKTKDAETKANDRIIRAELKAAALKAGMVDLDGLKLADLSSVKLNESGEVEGADDLMESLKKSKPYLFKETTSTSSTTAPPPKKEDTQKSAREMSDAEWKAEKKKLGLR